MNDRPSLGFGYESVHGLEDVVDMVFSERGKDVVEKRVKGGRSTWRKLPAPRPDQRQER